MPRKTLIKVRKDITANWVDVVLDVGEFGYDETTKQLKIGDGSTVFQSLTGINADMLDGEHGFSYSLTSHNHKLDDLIAPDDNTDLNATTSVHGLLPKLPVPSVGGDPKILYAGNPDPFWDTPPDLADLSDVMVVSPWPYEGDSLVYDVSEAKWYPLPIRHSMERQAIINSNYDIWQRGTSLAALDITFQYIADHWRMYINKDGGTLPTITHSKGTLTVGEIDKSFYYYRITTDGVGSAMGNNSMSQLGQLIEHGLRYLGGSGKKVTVSFKARSSIAGKRIGIFGYCNYGTGGSPSAPVYINGSNWTLTSDWQDCECTFTMPTLSGKTFGTDNNDYLGFFIFYQWGSGRQVYVGAASAEGYGGAGTIDFAQWQACAGGVALPFEPKTYAEELDSCLRYAFRVDSSLNMYTTFGFVTAWNANYSQYIISLTRPMRTTPTLTYSDTGDFKVFREGGNYTNISSITINTMMKSALQGDIHWDSSSGFTTGAGNFQADNTTSAWLLFSAEL